VTVDDDDVGTLTGRVEDETGASNEKSNMPVPAVEETVAKTDLTSNASSDISSETEVAELHDVVTDMVEKEIRKDDVGSPIAKFNPKTLTELRPQVAPFLNTWDTRTASKLKIGIDVPAAPPTLTADSPNIVLIEPLRQEIVVAEVQDDVLQATISSALVAVSSPTPKLSPTTVTELPPLTAALRAAPEATAASKLKTGADVPAIPPTLTADSPNIVPIEPLRQEIVVADVQDEVLQTIISSALVTVSSQTPKSSPATVTELPPDGAVF